MLAFSLDREQAWNPTRHVEKILGTVAGGDVTVACWEPGQISPYHCHPDATEIYFCFSGGGTMRTPKETIAVKPGAGGSALGVSLISSNQPDQDLADAIGRALALDPQVLLEPLLEGQEVTCAVLEDETGCPRALAPTLILPQRGAFYDFVSKYATGGSRHLCPAPLPEPLLERIKEVAVRAHQALGCRDLSRVDCFVDERRAPEDAVTVLEINTMPGMTSTSLFPEAAAASGMEFAKLCDHLVGLAHQRPGTPLPEAEPMPD